MKNPFPENMWPEDLIAIVHGEITLEEARYAAYAINQHEKLQAERDKLAATLKERDATIKVLKAALLREDKAKFEEKER